MKKFLSPIRPISLALIFLGMVVAEDKVPPPPPPPIDPSLLEITPLPSDVVPLTPGTNDKSTVPKPPDIDLSGAPSDLGKVAHSKTITRTAPLDYGDYVDVRLGLNLSARNINVEDTTGSQYSESFDNAGGGTLLILSSPGLHSVNGGLIYGGGIGWEGGIRTTTTNETETYDFYTLDLHLGYGFPFSRRLQLELLGGLGLGGGIYTNSANSSDSRSYSGLGIRYEIASNLVYTTTTGIQIGLHLGYSGTSASVSNDAYPVPEKLTITTRGIVGGLIIGTRL